MIEGNKSYQGHTVDHVLAILQKLSDQGKGAWKFGFGHLEHQLGAQIEVDTSSEHSPQVIVHGHQGQMAQLTTQSSEHTEPYFDGVKRETGPDVLVAAHRALTELADQAQSSGTPGAWVEEREKCIEAALESLRVVPEGWQVVPKLGALVSANHPITCLNPDLVFAVEYMRIDGGDRVVVRGDNTCWFGLRMIKPA